jgi:hypothetical protein
MPIYCYRNPRTKRLVERSFPMGTAPQTVRVGRFSYDRCLPAEVASQGGMQPSTWPMKSRALAVHPTQRRQYMEFAEKHGVPTHFDDMGHPVFQTKNHRKRYAELVGATDFDGGYGDPHCD